MTVDVLTDTAWAVLFYPLFPEKSAQGACRFSAVVSSRALGTVSTPRQGGVVNRCPISGGGGTNFHN